MSTWSDDQLNYASLLPTPVEVLIRALLLVNFFCIFLSIFNRLHAFMSRSMRCDFENTFVWFTFGIIAHSDFIEAAEKGSLKWLHDSIQSDAGFYVYTPILWAWTHWLWNVHLGTRLVMMSLFWSSWEIAWNNQILSGNSATIDNCHDRNSGSIMHEEWKMRAQRYRLGEFRMQAHLLLWP